MVLQEPPQERHVMRLERLLQHGVREPVDLDDEKPLVGAHRCGAATKSAGGAINGALKGEDLVVE
jgi:hypothetical protein